MELFDFDNNDIESEFLNYIKSVTDFSTENYTVLLDMENKEQVVNFLQTLVKIDGKILSTFVLEDILINVNTFLANLCISIPLGTKEEFESKSGIQLVKVNRE